MPDIYNIYRYEKPWCISGCITVFFYCKVPFLVQEMETVRVVEVISELERICEPVAEAYPVFPDFQLDLLVTFHAEELLSAVTSALVQEEVLPL